MEKNKTNEEKIKEIKAWAESSHAYLSNREGFARGYREGIAVAKEIVFNILQE